MIEHISGQLFNSLIVRLWDKLLINESLHDTDNLLRNHFKENGPAKLPGNDFEDLGLDLDDFKIEDDEIFGNELNMDQKEQYAPAVQKLCELKQVKDLYIANIIDQAVSMAIEAFKVTNIANFNALESSKDDLTET